MTQRRRRRDGGRAGGYVGRAEGDGGCSSCQECALKLAGPALVCLLPVMFALEPILHCMNSGGELVEEHEGQRTQAGG